MPRQDNLPTRFDPGQFEAKWYDFWLKHNYFQARHDLSGPIFSMVIPPPNVTGKLHIGHALNNTLQDIIVRYRRMSGHQTLWLPGTDHAGIATQMVVERDLMKEGQTRHGLGREAFLEKMWSWKQQYKDNIKNQLTLLGCSCDWSRERFTLDEGLSRTVRHVFSRLHKDGLLYRDRMIVNWCPRCQTALSDLEVQHQDVKGKLYYIYYPLKNGQGKLKLATTRPETLLGDTAVAVNPEDDRYSALVGSEVALPLTNRFIPIVAHSMVDRDFGTGVVKVTPAHDPNDFIVARDLDLPGIIIMDEKGVMNDEAGDYQGLDRFEARRRMLKDLEDQDLLAEVKDHQHAVGHCQRCQTMLEPYLSKQWFVRMKPLAEPAIRAVESGEITFIPEMWTKTYYEWMTNIHDWCVSRQIWWGHRIPVYICTDCGHEMVSEEEPSGCERCSSNRLVQDQDVLDTWFSSALWPFSTLGWPENTPDLQQFYPTTCLITGFDILFFWVARMIMMGLYCTGKVPFREVYLNALVRDSKGQKMSKTRGNVIEPEVVCGQFGADAVRFTLSIHASPGRDIPLAPERMEGYKAFITKIWNAARFVTMKVPVRPRFQEPENSLLSKWILSIFNTLVDETRKSLDIYRFDLAANQLYHFMWHEYCDWFIELAKPYLSGELGNEAERLEVESTLYYVLDETLKLLHPFMPFVTEEIWQVLKTEGESITVAPYPEHDPHRLCESAEKAVEWLKELTSRVRSFRVSSSLPPTTPLDLHLAEEVRNTLKDLIPLIQDLAWVNHIQWASSVEMGFVDHIAGVPFGILIPEESLSPELKERLIKELEKMQIESEKLDSRLSNDQFLQGAPEHVIEKQRQKLAEMVERIRLFKNNLHQI